MVVYNITLQLNRSIEQDWLQWQKNEHAPEVLATGCFNEYKMFLLLGEESSETVTYVVQYFAPRIEDYKHYMNEYAPALRKKMIEKWGDKFIAFRTAMQVVH